MSAKKRPCNSFTFIEIMGLAIGSKIGNNRTGKMNDLFLAYIENAETRVPVMHKSRVGSKIATRKNNQIGTFKIIPEGFERRKPNNIRTTSIKLSRRKPNKILLIKMMFGETGAERIPFNVPDSFSLMNNLAIRKMRVKKIMTQISITKISEVIFCS